MALKNGSLALETLDWKMGMSFTIIIISSSSSSSSSISQYKTLECCPYYEYGIGCIM